MSAERVGREIDETAIQLGEGASDALGRAGDRAENLAEETRDEIANDAQASDEEPNYPESEETN